MSSRPCADSPRFWTIPLLCACLRISGTVGFKNELERRGHFLLFRGERAIQVLPKTRYSTYINYSTIYDHLGFVSPRVDSQSALKRSIVRARESSTDSIDDEAGRLYGYANVSRGPTEDGNDCSSRSTTCAKWAWST